LPHFPQEKKRKQEEAIKRKEADVEKEKEMAERYHATASLTTNLLVGRRTRPNRGTKVVKCVVSCGDVSSRARANQLKAEAERRARQDQARRQAEEEERRLKEVLEKKLAAEQDRGAKAAQER
jgi:hypothetical protein